MLERLLQVDIFIFCNFPYHPKFSTKQPNEIHLITVHPPIYHIFMPKKTGDKSGCEKSEDVLYLLKLCTVHPPIC